jgi:DNA-binding protein
MFSDLPSEPSSEPLTEGVAPSDIQQLPLLPFAVQVQNIFPIEIVARRFPVDKAVDMASVVISNVSTELNLGELGIDTEALQAQVHLEVKVSFPQEPRLFEIYFKLVGIFSYAQHYKPEMVQYFLQQGSLSVMLPSARELLLSLCTRLQVPMVVLPLVQLAPPPSSNPETGNTSSNE